MKKLTLTAAGSLIALTASLGAAQADKLTLYCSAQEDWCQLMARSFEDATGIDVDMTRKSSGETFAIATARSASESASPAILVAPKMARSSSFANPPAKISMASVPSVTILATAIGVT